jgi:tRNA pseudouridine38-40 synthase
MPRYRITIEYDGTPFVGWQVQSDGVSVQGAVETALQRFTGEQPRLFGAGRTDAGVHALGQVAHFDLTRPWDPLRLREAINFHLRPLPISVLLCSTADADFDARFSATRRHYLYRILSRRAPPALLRDRVWWVPRLLDDAAMHAAAQHLVGKHDFTTFRAAACQARSPTKTLDRLDVAHSGDEIVIRATARSFLHNQVRSMVGTLKLVGEGRWTPGDVASALASRNRARCGPVAPSMGLYLEAVDYDTQTPATSG